MIELQEKMYKMRMKVVMNCESLKEQETNLSEVVETYNNKIPEWEKAVNVLRLNSSKIHNKSLKFDSDYKVVLLGVLCYKIIPEKC